MATGAALINSHCLQALVLLMFSSKYLADFVMQLGVTRAACTRVHHDRDHMCSDQAALSDISTPNP